MTTNNTIDGWQTLTDAARKTKCSHQRLRQLIDEDKIESIKIYGRILVPDPLDWRPDKDRQLLGRKNRLKSA